MRSTLNLNRFQIIWAVLVALMIAICNSGATVDSINRRWFGAAIIVVSAFPMLQFWGSKVRYLPLFALNSAYYAFGFGVGGFVLATDRFEGRATDVSVEFSQLMVVLGVISMATGYRFAKNVRLISLPRLENLTMRQVTACGWMMFLFSLAPYVYSEFAKIPSLGQLIRLSSMAGTTLLFYSLLEGGMKREWRPVFVLLLAYVIWQGLLTGSIAEGLRYGIVLAVVAVYQQRRNVAIVVGAISVLMLIAFNPIKHEYRAIVWNTSEGWQLDAWDKSRLLVDIGTDYWVRGKSLSVDQERNSTVDRLNQFPLLALVVEATPKTVPYWSGATYLDIFYVLIPRALWPDKPTKRLGNEFGQRYSVLHENDNTTSLNFPWVIEFYANFGWIGVLLGMAICGALFRDIESNLLSGSSGSITTIGLFSPLCFPESNFSLMWGGIALGFVSLLMGTRLAKKFISP